MHHHHRREEAVEAGTRGRTLLGVTLKVPLVCVCVWCTDMNRCHMWTNYLFDVCMRYHMCVYVSCVLYLRACVCVVVSLCAAVLLFCCIYILKHRGTATV